MKSPISDKDDQKASKEPLFRQYAAINNMVFHFCPLVLQRVHLTHWIHAAFILLDRPFSLSNAIRPKTEKKMTTKEYVKTVSERLQSGISREHSYRGNLETLIRDLVQGMEITNEPKNVTDCGNPDYVWFQFFQNGELVHEIKIGSKSFSGTFVYWELNQKNISCHAIDRNQNSKGF